MEGDFTAFTIGGGAAKFTSALSTNLGIKTSQITIIDSYAGSIVLLYDLKAAPG